MTLQLEENNDGRFVTCQGSNDLEKLKRSGEAMLQDREENFTNYRIIEEAGDFHDPVVVYQKEKQ